MREIKFRAWDCYNYKMIESHEPILFNRIIPLCYPHNHFKDKDGGAKECFLMQFTGLKDKSGVDIYENMEIDDLYNVEFKNGSYVLVDISSGDIVLLYSYINSRGGNVKVTREYTKI